jgi:hypothetical protein
MQLSRRQVILGAGGTALALVGAAGVFTVTKTAEAAVAPWRLDPQAGLDPRLDVFRHAILAPNPHNRQPWVLRLVGADEAVVSCDLDRRLPETDPLDRQITVGFGCFLELAAIAGSRRGIRVEQQMFPEGESEGRLDARPVARLRFVADPAVKADSLSAHITARRSNKEPYDPARRVPAEALAQLKTPTPAGLTLATSDDPAFVAAMRDLTWRSFETEFGTKRTHMESVRLMRIGAAEVDANPDGISLRGPMIESLRLAGLVSREQLAKPGSTAFQAGLDRYRGITGTAQAYLWINTEGNRARDRIAAGRLYLRTNLAATALGLSMSPLSQALQEFPEMREHYAEMHRRLAPGGGTVQMLARLGYGPEVAPSPRWPVEAKVAPSSATS